MKTRNTLRLSFSTRKLAMGGWLAAFFCLLPAYAPAQTAVQEWVQRYNGPANGDDSTTAMVVDTSGNVIVTGYSANINVSPYNYDYATIKYSSAGVPLWTNRYNGPADANDNAYALAVDGSNNIIVTGMSDGVGGLRDYATVKYSGDGVPLWTNRYSGPGSNEDQGRAVVVDGSNNVIVTGISFGGSSWDFVTIKYSSAGVPLWTNCNNGLGVAYAVAVDNSNNLIVTGNSVDSAEQDCVTVKYSSDGVPLWTNRYSGPGSGEESARAVAVDSHGNVIVTGYSPGIGIRWDYATIKYSTAGVPLWTNRYNGPGNSFDAAVAVAVDGSNNVIVTGKSRGSGSGDDYATIKYSSDGVPLWTNRYNGPGNGIDVARALAVDTDNNVIVTGYSANGNVSPYTYDYVTIGYSSAGVPLWTNLYTGAGNHDDYAAALAVDPSGNVYVTGNSWGNGSGPDYATIKYAVLRPIPLAFQRMANQLVLSWTNAAFSLQCAPAITGAFTNIPGTTSPYTNPITGAQQFFRLISN